MNRHTTLGRAEWQAWQTICGRLRALGIVTEDDLRTPVGSPPTTAGQCLLGELRVWGDLRGRLMSAEDY